MRFVFVMDPVDRIDPDRDTTFGFISTAYTRGHDCFHCLPQHVEFSGGQLAARLRQLEVQQEAGLVLVGERWVAVLADFDAVFIRKDPPFDAAYQYATLLLELGRGKTVLLNDPRGLREANEKLYTLNFVQFSPPTLVSANRDAIHDFVAQVGGAGVIKPLDGAGGFGVMALRSDDQNVRSIVDHLTQEGRRLVVVQQLLPAVEQGDKRVLLLDGEPLGAILRVPPPGELRANIHVGAEVRAVDLTPRETAIVTDIAPRLRQDGLVFVGLDFIGEKLTEINVTSPTGIRELGQLTGTNPAEQVIDWVEGRVRSDTKLGP